VRADRPVKVSSAHDYFGCTRREGIRGVIPIRYQRRDFQRIERASLHQIDDVWQVCSGVRAPT